MTRGCLNLIVDSLNETLEMKQSGITHVLMPDGKKHDINAVLFALTMMAWEENIDIATQSIEKTKSSKNLLDFLKKSKEKDTVLSST